MCLLVLRGNFSLPLGRYPAGSVLVTAAGTAVELDYLNFDWVDKINMAGSERRL